MTTIAELHVAPQPAPDPGDAGGPWPMPAGEPRHLVDAACDEWRDTTARLREIAGHLSLSRSEVARRANIPVGTLSPWYDGKYQGNYPNITARVRAFIQAHEEQTEFARAQLAEPDFVATPVAMQVLTGLTFAQQLGSIALIILGPGMGKTTCAKHFVATKTFCHRVVMRPTTGSAHQAMAEIATQIGVEERNPARLASAIGARMKSNGRKTLLIIDEAQNLSPRAVDELRFLSDEYGTGLAFLGNLDVNTRFGGTEPREGYGQAQRRIGFRLTQLKPKRADIDAFVAAWGLTDPAIVKLLRQIGEKPGALGQITGTLKMAALMAAGHGRPIHADDVLAAYVNRCGGGLS